MIEVRRVKSEAEFRRLYDLFVEYEADLPPNLRHGTVPEIASLHVSYANRNAAFIAGAVAEPVGCVATREHDAESALLLRLFVRPPNRGSGAARALVETAIAYARSVGYRRMVLDTNKERLMPAYRLYRSLGFLECEPFVDVAYECPTFMQLRLQQ